jgi:hypothetical protein
VTARDRPADADAIATASDVDVDVAQRTTFEEFGREFFHAAVTEERISGAFRGLAGDTFEFGPLAVGPAKIAKVNAAGRIGTPTVERADATELQFHIAIPVDVDLTVHLPLDDHRFQAALVVHLLLTPRPAPPLRVVIDVRPPGPKDVEVQLKAATMRGSLLQSLAGIDVELRRFVAKYVSREIDKPHIRAARDIDVAARIAGAWQG